MALSRTPLRCGPLRDFITNYVLTKEDLPKLQVGKKVGHLANRTPGYQWLEHHYRLSVKDLLWYNVIRYHFTNEVLVGKDWRGNLFFMKEDPAQPGGAIRFAKFIEGWELPQDYDADFLWKKWLEYRMHKAPTPQQCARLYKYNEEKYDIKQIAIKRMQEEDAIDPPHERVRRYQEYTDQKWDIRRMKGIMNNVVGQQWLQRRASQPDIQDKDFYSQKQSTYEAYNYMKLDLLRPPKKQHLWKLEDDVRAYKYLEALENPDYKLDPFKYSRKERYMRTPSHVAGNAVPDNQTKIVPVFNKKLLPPVPHGELRLSITDVNPIYGMSSAAEYQKWFAEQRKHLIAARSELEQMKRDGYRPQEIGGDLDPYEAARPLEDYAARRERRKAILDAARTERMALEEKKKDAFRALVGGMQDDMRVLDEARTKPFEETAIYTMAEGKIEPGAARRYRNRQLASTTVRGAQALLDDDTENVTPEGDMVKSVFGERGGQIFSGTLRHRESASAEVTARPDVAAPVLPSEQPSVGSGPEADASAPRPAGEDKK